MEQELQQAKTLIGQLVMNQDRLFGQLNQKDGQLQALEKELAKCRESTVEAPQG